MAIWNKKQREEIEADKKAEYTRDFYVICRLSINCETATASLRPTIQPENKIIHALSGHINI